MKDKTIIVKVAILDDCDEDMDVCEKYLIKISSSEIKYHCSRFHKPDNGFYLQYDMYYIDIEMPDISGFEVAKKVKQIQPQSFIIFYSHKNELVFQSFYYGAFNFVRKDHFEIDMERTRDLFKIQLKKALKTYLFHRNGIIKEIPYKDIVYIEKDQNNISLHISDNTVLYDKMSIKKVAASLEKEGFMYCHQSIVVNLAYVKGIEKSDFILHNNERIPISRRNLKNTVNEYYKYLIRKDN